MPIHIKKYDVDYSRRFFLDKMSKGIMGAGVLTSLWPLIGEAADITKAYPEELLSIDAFTQGKLKDGDIIDASNVEIVKDLIDPIAYAQVSQHGRRIKLVPTTTDVTKLFPHDYLKATLANQGKAALDADGNVVVKGSTDRWIGGLPFIEPKNGLEAFADITLSWGRHDTSIYAVEDHDINPDGSIDYEYQLAWCEQNHAGLVSNPSGVYREGLDDAMRHQSIWFTAPDDSRGTSFLNIWKYDQRKFPDLFGYLPAFKRVRRFPTNQRFEPIVPGFTFFLSDAWAAGDPMLTWGNHKIVGRGPFLGCQSEMWQGDKENWSKDHLVHGGKKGNTFYEASYQLCPEVIVVEAEPVGFQKIPVSKKRVWFDARNMTPIAYVTFDKEGNLFRSFEMGFSQQKKGGMANLDANGNPEWSFSHIHSYDMQTNRMTRLNQAEKIKGGVRTQFDSEGAYEKYLTIQAIRKLGS